MLLRLSNCGCNVGLGTENEIDNANVNLSEITNFPFIISIELTLCVHGLSHFIDGSPPFATFHLKLFILGGRTTHGWLVSCSFDFFDWRQIVGAMNFGHHDQRITNIERRTRTSSRRATVSHQCAHTVAAIIFISPTSAWKYLQRHWVVQIAAWLSDSFNSASCRKSIGHIQMVRSSWSSFLCWNRRNLFGFSSRSPSSSRGNVAHLRWNWANIRVHGWVIVISKEMTGSGSRRGKSLWSWCLYDILFRFWFRLIRTGIRYFLPVTTVLTKLITHFYGISFLMRQCTICILTSYRFYPTYGWCIQH